LPHPNTPILTTFPCRATARGYGTATDALSIIQAIIQAIIPVIEAQTRNNPVEAGEACRPG
jgi:hypothetical protein